MADAPLQRNVVEELLWGPRRTRTGRTSRSCPRWYPGVQIALVPFGERALRHFIYLERPEGMDLDDAEGFAAVGQAEPLTDGDPPMAVPEDYQTVGHLYRGIEHGLEWLVARHGEAGLFIPIGRKDITGVGVFA